MAGFLRGSSFQQEPGNAGFPSAYHSVNFWSPDTGTVRKQASKADLERTVDLNHLIAVAGYCSHKDPKSFTPVAVGHAMEIRNYRYFTSVRASLQPFKEVSSSDNSLVPDDEALYVTNLLEIKVTCKLITVSPKRRFFKRLISTRLVMT